MKTGIRKTDEIIFALRKRKDVSSEVVFVND